MSSICELCEKNPATAHLTEVADNGRDLQELHICNGCMSRLHLDLPNNPPAIAEILAMAENSDHSDTDVEIEVNVQLQNEDSGEDDSARCPDCGISYSEFSKNNRFGCATDYQTFSDELTRLFDELQGASQHIGRGPGNADQHAQLLDKRIRLERKLQDVIAEERFEEAARIRDELKELDG